MSSPAQQGKPREGTPPSPRPLSDGGVWAVLVLVGALIAAMLVALAWAISVNEIAVDAVGTVAADAGKKEDFGIGAALHSYGVALAIAIAASFGIYLLFRMARIGGGVEALAPGELEIPSLPFMRQPTRAMRSFVVAALLAYAVIGVGTLLWSTFGPNTHQGATIVALLLVVISSFVALSGVLTGSDLDPAILELAKLGGVKKSEGGED